MGAFNLPVHIIFVAVHTKINSEFNLNSKIKADLQIKGIHDDNTMVNLMIIIKLASSKEYFNIAFVMILRNRIIN